MKKAILFDFDGTIIDSQPLINGYFFEVLKNKGITLTSAEKHRLGGVSIEESLDWLRKTKGLRMSYLEQKYHMIYFALFKLRHIKTFPGVREVLNQVKALGYKTAIVTNSPRRYTKYLIKENEIQECFDTIVSVDDVGVAKPDPAMLKVAAARLGVTPKNCIMVDDHEPGIIAGQKLQMKTIHISEKKLSKKEKKADITLQKIHDIVNLIRQ